MISHKFKFIFIHVPKCGGTSVMEALHGYYDRWLGHEIPRGIKKKIKSRNFYVFTCVRNPWSRAVSNYCYAQKKKSYWHSDDGSTEYDTHSDYNIVKDITFEDYIYLLSRDEIESVHTRSQYSFLKHHIKHIDNIMRLETIDSDYEKFCIEKNIPNKLCHVNKATRKKYTDYYTSNSLIDMVGDIYSADVQKFNYTYLK